MARIAGTLPVPAIRGQSVMWGLSDEGQRIVEDVAQRHGVSADAVATLLRALAAGQGSQAQFSHPELGGMGQWSQGGMIMVGDMFNQGLKYRVDSLCTELSGLLRNTEFFARAPMASQSQSQSSNGQNGGVSLFVSGGFGSRWPAELGQPSSAGSQNDLHYALFPAMRRLAIEQRGRVTVYDIGDHQIGGFSQQQGGDQSLTFTSQYGLVRVADLRTVPLAGDAAPSPPPEQPGAPPPQQQQQWPAPSFEPPSPIEPAVSSPGASPIRTGNDDEIFSKLERLADLHRKDVITTQEFEAKKAELLARL